MGLGRLKYTRLCAAFSVFLGLVSALVLIYTLNARMRPILTALAFAEIRNDMVLLLTQAADSLCMSYNYI